MSECPAHQNNGNMQDKKMKQKESFNWIGKWKLPLLSWFWSGWNSLAFVLKAVCNKNQKLKHFIPL